MSDQKFIPEGWNECCSPFKKETLEKAIGSKDIFEGLVYKCDANYNLYVNLGNQMIGIIPRDEIEAINVDETGFPKPNICVNKVNKYVQFRVKNRDARDQFILSRKSVGKDALSWMKEELTPGMVVDGIVKSIQPYGAFIEIGGGVVGLLHIEDISVARIKTPSERLKIGQKIKVLIKSIDKKFERVILSYKELFGTWEENAKQFEEGSVVTGIVRETEKTKNGIFVELNPNLVGMAEYKNGLEYGEKIKVYIKKIIPEKKKIKLTII